MGAPALAIQTNGGPPVSGDNFNTYEQTCDTASDLRSFIGIQGVEVYLRGQSAPNDGYQGVFYWNTSGTSPDDNGVTTIAPYGSGSGVWSRINDVNNAYTYVVPLTGFSLLIGNGVSSLLLNPAGTLAFGSFTLPVSPIDGQIVRVSSTQTLTVIAVSPSAGQSLFNAPTALSAGVGFAFQYSLPQLTWFRLY